MYKNYKEFMDILEDLTYRLSYAYWDFSKRYPVFAFFVKLLSLFLFFLVFLLLVCSIAYFIYLAAIKAGFAVGLFVAMIVIAAVLALFSAC